MLSETHIIKPLQTILFICLFILTKDLNSDHGLVRILEIVENYIYIYMCVHTAATVVAKTPKALMLQLIQDCGCRTYFKEDESSYSKSNSTLSLSYIFS